MSRRAAVQFSNTLAMDLGQFREKEREWLAPHEENGPRLEAEREALFPGLAEVAA